MNMHTKVLLKKHCVKRAFVALLLCNKTNPSQAAANSNTIRGHFSVGDNCAAPYSIPIEDPIGINGIRPNTTFGFSGMGSQRQAEHAFSSVSRTIRYKATIVTEGFRGSTSMDYTDRICIPQNWCAPLTTSMLRPTPSIFMRLITVSRQRHIQTLVAASTHSSFPIKTPANTNTAPQP